MNKYASKSYASWDPLAISVQDDIVLWGISIQNANIKTSFSDEWNQVDFQNFNFPRSNWRWLLGYYLRGKNLTLNISIKWSDADDFQDRLDELRGAIFKSEINLDIKVKWVVRRIKVNCTSFPKTLNHYNIDWVKWTITLETLEPFFYLLWNQTSSFLSKSASFDEYIINKGTGVAETRTFITFWTGLSSVTSVAVTIWNKTLTISEAINDSDAIVINWEDKTVKINNVEKDYLGEFPLLENWGNVVTFTIDGTWNADINIINKVNYV